MCRIIAFSRVNIKCPVLYSPPARHFCAICNAAVCYVPHYSSLPRHFGAARVSTMPVLGDALVLCTYLSCRCWMSFFCVMFI